MNERRQFLLTAALGVAGLPPMLASAQAAESGKPANIVEKINKTVNDALADPKMKMRLADLGGIPMGGTPADFGKVMASETAKWEKAVKFSGASIE